MANRRPLVIGSAFLPQQFDGAADTLDVNGPMIVTGALDAGGATSLEIPNGAGGTAVNATGEVTIDTTSDTLNFYDGTVERVLTPYLSKAVTVETPTATEDISLFFTKDAITISEMRAVVRGTTPSLTWTVKHGTDRSAAGAAVVTAGTTTTSVSTGSDVTSFNDATIVADSFVWLETTAESGTTDEFHLTIIFDTDA